MCSENSLNQINAAIERLKNATSKTKLLDTQTESLAFVLAAFEAKEITQKEKLSFDRNIRNQYRKQLVEEHV